MILRTLKCGRVAARIQWLLLSLALLAWAALVQAQDKYWVVAGDSVENCYFVPLAGSENKFPEGHEASLVVADTQGKEFGDQADAPVKLNPTWATAGTGGNKRLPPDPASIAVKPTIYQENAGECRVLLKFTRANVPGGPQTWLTVYKWVVVAVTDVTCDGATRITKKKGDQGMEHFVTPKASGNATLTAKIVPDITEVRAKITWEGATQDANDKLKATFPRSPAAKNAITIKMNGLTAKKARGWVVWAEKMVEADGQISLIRGPVDDGHDPQQTGPGVGVNAGKWGFSFTIAPLDMLRDDDAPDFTGINKSDPPAGTHIVYGTSLKGGADSKWDVSRRIRVKALCPSVGTAWFDKPGGAIYDNLPAAEVIQESFPTDPALGNDDYSTTEENNVPDSQGKVTSEDCPTLPSVRDAGGTVGDTIEFRIQFGEFLRLEIEGKWTRVSDFQDWRLHAKLKKVSEAADNMDYNGNGNKTDELWIDNGSVTDDTNKDW